MSQRGEYPGDPDDPVRPDDPGDGRLDGLLDDAQEVEGVEYETEVAHYHRPLLGPTWIAGLIVIPALLAAIGLLGQLGPATPPPTGQPTAAAPSAPAPAPDTKALFAIAADGKTVTVGGAVPDATAKAAVIKALKQGYGTAANVADRLTLDPAAPAVDATAFGELAAALKGVRGVTLDAGPGAVRVSGAAADDAAKAALLTALGKAYPGVPVESAGVLVGDPAQPPASCDVTAHYVAVVTAETRITFGTGGSALTADSQAALKRIADALVKCPSLKVTVAGNTDSKGSADKNQTLSEERAAAVKKALEGLGVAGDRITATGNGPSKPLASNDTPVGQSVNRRVDVTVQ